MRQKVRVELAEGMTIPSVNEHKQPNWRAKRMYKKPQIDEFQESLRYRLRNAGLGEITEFSNPKVEVWFKFCFKNRFWIRDVSNMIKATEDALRDVIGIDDSRTLKIHGEKEKIEGKIEIIEIELEITE